MKRKNQEKTTTVVEEMDSEKDLVWDHVQHLT